MPDDDLMAFVGISSIIVVVGLIVTAVVDSGPKNDFATMCQNSDYIRVDDSECDRGVSGTSVMYISTNSNYNAPALGARIDQGKVVRTLPSGKTAQKGGISATGGVVKASKGIIRGGFGSGKGSSSS